MKPKMEEAQLGGVIERTVATHLAAGGKPLGPGPLPERWLRNVSVRVAVVKATRKTTTKEIYEGAGWSQSKWSRYTSTWRDPRCSVLAELNVMLGLPMWSTVLLEGTVDEVATSGTA